MSKAEKIKAEIERRLKIIEPNLPSREVFDKVADRNPGINSDFNIGEKMGAYTMLKKIEQFIDSIEEEPVSNDLEEAARKIATRHSHISGDTYYANDAWVFKKGAQWQKERILNNAIEREVKVDAGGYPYIDVTELYNYDKDKPLAKKGDKVKLIIIMEE